jgi:hypothetical protein
MAKNVRMFESQLMKRGYQLRERDQIPMESATITEAESARPRPRSSGSSSLRTTDWPTPNLTARIKLLRRLRSRFSLEMT